MKLVYRILFLNSKQQKELGTYSQVLSFLESVDDSVTDESLVAKYEDVSIKIISTRSLAIAAL